MIKNILLFIMLSLSILSCSEKCGECETKAIVYDNNVYNEFESIMLNAQRDDLENYCGDTYEEMLHRKQIVVLDTAFAFNGDTIFREIILTVVCN